ncbi:hypothetical protein ACQKFM_08840 [Paenibacillus xylanexedens]|uniref:hypothetical protein n=1 Tax=Paenibacillus xylanexedens TaxID=528191 RepID=UPI003D0442F8
MTIVMKLFCDIRMDKGINRHVLFPGQLAVAVFSLTYQEKLANIIQNQNETFFLKVSFNETKSWDVDHNKPIPYKRVFFITIE